MTALAVFQLMLLSSYPVIQSITMRPCSLGFPAIKEYALKNKIRNSHCGSVQMNLISIHKDSDWVPGLAQWVKDPALP